MDPGAFKRTRVRTALIAGGIGLCVVAGAVRWLRSGPSRVLTVAAGTRLLTVSRGTLYWLGRTCSIWRADLDGGRAMTEPLEPALLLDECPPDDPRVDGAVIYQPASIGHVTRFSPRRRAVILERNLLYALALDSKYIYVGNCTEADNCEIERLPADDYPGDPTLMQAGIHALTNMDVDEKEIFWVDRGRQRNGSVPPRLMAADKKEPRAVERVVLTDFDGRRPLLGARHVYWLGQGGVHRVPKAGGENVLVLPTRVLSGFAADGDDVYFGANGGLFHAREGEAPRSLQRTELPPRGVAVDADFVYWIDDRDGNAIFRRRR